MKLALMNKVRTKCAEKDQPCTLWGEAVLPCKTGPQPQYGLVKIWLGDNDFFKVRVFGSQAYMLKLPQECKL
ncbi:hypothetical protein PR048_009332 [Dryococelus australis]|uniref:Uncharacterized protein n=1 Tax=Dryococelus australis TaxID=614101 RepID=A0ABQ9HZK8_9NEOP|nr:hypothetical protein PR048_009332 [Dryococelus australis]